MLGGKGPHMKKETKWLPAGTGNVILAGSALAIGLVAGRFSAGPPQEQRGEGISPPGETGNRIAATGQSEGERGRVGDVRSGEKLLRVLSEANGTGKWRALLASVDRLATEDFPAFAGKMVEEGMDVAYRNEYLMVLTAWAERDPTAAAEFLDSGQGDAEMKAAVMAAWAEADPGMAEAWARSHHEGSEANPWMVGVIQGIAAADVDRARGLVEELPRGGQRNRAFRSVLAHVYAMGSGEAAAWLNGVTDEKLQKDGAEWLAERFAVQDPVSAGEWIAHLPGEDVRRKASEEVASAYARQDLEGAQAWVLTLPEEIRMTAAGGVIDQLARQDPVAAFHWLSQIGSGAELDDARRDIVRRGFDQDPAAALTTALHLADGRTRERYTERYLRRWMETDAQSAMNWVRAYGAHLPEATREFYQGSGN